MHRSTIALLLKARKPSAAAAAKPNPHPALAK
jgi:hypothetical protein